MKIKLKREENGHTEEVAAIVVNGGQAVLWAGGSRFVLDTDTAREHFISLCILEANNVGRITQLTLPNLGDSPQG
jgi:hypothetical protein